MVEGARLESVYTGNRIKGSNPFFTATFDSAQTPVIPSEAGVLCFWCSDFWTIFRGERALCILRRVPPALKPIRH